MALRELHGPAVISLWASWCAPCRDELPHLQQLADQNAGRLRVIGVNSADSRDAAASFAADQHVTLPTIFDHGQKLLGALGLRDLPVTVFVDAGGRRYVLSKPLDLAELPELVQAHTGVAVAR